MFREVCLEIEKDLTYHKNNKSNFVSYVVARLDKSLQLYEVELDASTKSLLQKNNINVLNRYSGGVRSGKSS